MGDHESDSVQCHTDLTTCCSSEQNAPGLYHRGDWFLPGSIHRLGFEGGGDDIYQLREAQRVDLRRRNNALSPSGVYRCGIATEAVHSDYDSMREMLYVGIYGSGGTISCVMGQL